MILLPWDYAAGSIIVMEAGGTITKVDGSEITLDKPCSILASNGRREMQRWIRSTIKRFMQAI